MDSESTEKVSTSFYFSDRNGSDCRDQNPACQSFPRTCFLTHKRESGEIQNSMKLGTKKAAKEQFNSRNKFECVPA